MKKLLVSLMILIALATAPGAFAQTTCVNSYGQGVVCGARTPEIKYQVVDAGIGDVSLKVIGIGLLISSAVLYRFKLKASA